MSTRDELIEAGIIRPADPETMALCALGLTPLPPFGTGIRLDERGRRVARYVIRHGRQPAEAILPKPTERDVGWKHAA